MSAFYNGKQTLGVILHEVDDGGGTLLPGDTAVAGKVLILCGKLDGGVDGSTLPVPEWYKSGPSVGSHTSPPPQTSGYTGSPYLSKLVQWSVKWRSEGGGR